MPKQVFWLSELSQEDNGLVGKKCANLGEMTRLQIPVPLGFAISVTAQELFLEETGARREIEELLEGAGDLRDYMVAAEVSAKIQAIIEGKEMPPVIGDAITSYYEGLCSKRDCEVAVSVRSAGIVSHPGMYETYLNIRGTSNVLAMVKKVWASIFNHRTVCAAVQHNLPVAGSPCIGVGVIELVNARSAGVCFTVHPTTGDPSTAVIEANWGLGESVVSGQVDIDRYVIDKESLRVIERTLGQKEMQIVSKGHGVAEEELSAEMRSAYVLTDDEAIEIVKIGMSLESHFCAPQDLEFTIASDKPFPHNVFLLQTRGVVGVKVQDKKTPEDKLKAQLAKRLGRIV
jgi:pyruvate, water dikinase